MAKDKHPGGRPSTYTPEIAAKLCEQIALGSSLRTACKGEDMPAPSTVFKWIREHEEFSKQYAHACEERTEAMSEDILDIADDGTNDWMEQHRGEHVAWVTNGEAIQRSRVRIDTRKWLMAKMKPKKYGDKIDMTTNGKDLPTPILGGLSVHSDNSDEKDTRA